MIAPSHVHLHVGGILFPQMDQADFTGPFELLSRIPNSTFHVLSENREPVQDAKGLVLTPQELLSESPQLDVLLVPGGLGVNALMENETVLGFLRNQAAGAKLVFSVCTGALVCGAAGLLRGRQATTHWASRHLLEYFGANPVDERVVIDGNIVTTAGVTAGIDGALRVIALLRGKGLLKPSSFTSSTRPNPLSTMAIPDSLMKTLSAPDARLWAGR